MSYYEEFLGDFRKIADYIEDPDYKDELVKESAKKSTPKMMSGRPSNEEKKRNSSFAFKAISFSSFEVNPHAVCPKVK
jgi:hypothetical protein